MSARGPRRPADTGGHDRLRLARRDRDRRRARLPDGPQPPRYRRRDRGRARPRGPGAGGARWSGRRRSARRWPTASSPSGSTSSSSSARCARRSPASSSSCASLTSPAPSRTPSSPSRSSSPGAARSSSASRPRPWSPRCGGRRRAAAGANCSCAGSWSSPGMAAHVDFDEQVIVAGGQRPDMVVRLAGGKNVVVDSKVSLSAYLEAASARRRGQPRGAAGRPRQAPEDARGPARRRRRTGRRCRRHPEFVVMFVPGEAFLAPALDHRPRPARVRAGPPGAHRHADHAGLHAAHHPVRLAAAEAVGERAGRVRTRPGAVRPAVRSRQAPGARRQVADVTRSASYNQAVGSLETRVLVSARKLSALGVVDAELAPPEPVTETARPLAAPELDRATEAPDGPTSAARGGAGRTSAP